MASLYFLVLLSTLGLSSALDSWHERVGFPEAARILKHEQSIVPLAQEVQRPIVGGFVAALHAHPHLAGLVVDIRGSPSPSACGGTLLTSSRVLTAAHCWHDGHFQAWRFTVVLGSPYLFYGGTRIPTSSVSIHENYEPVTLANDIAMVYLPVHVSFSAAVRPATLPSDAMLHLDLTGLWATAAGYGRYSDLTNPTHNTVVREVQLQVISREACRRTYGRVVLDSNLCTAGAGGVGICRGDSGGPLAVPLAGQHVLLGVSSFVATAGCELGHPSVFANPQKHNPRIDFPTRSLSSGEVLRANCTTAPALPAPHITWFINGEKMDEVKAHTHKFRVPMSERSARRGLHVAAPDAAAPGLAAPSPASLPALSHASFIATRLPGCSLREHQISDMSINQHTHSDHGGRHRSRKPGRRDLYITVSELQLVASGRQEIVCVSTIPEFRNIDDKFADVRNDTVIVDVISPSTFSQPAANLTAAEPSNSSLAGRLVPSLLVPCILHSMLRHVA